jgi:hypothetical protein
MGYQQRTSISDLQKLRRFFGQSGTASGSGSTKMLKNKFRLQLFTEYLAYLDPGSVREVNILGSVTPNPLVRTVGEENFH